MRPILKGMKDVYALDLGTTKFCLAALRESANIEDGGWKVETLSVPADGMRRGMVSNVDQARNALNELVTQAERALSSDVRKVVVGIAGSHLQGKSSTMKRFLDQGVVSTKDIHLLTETVEREHTSEGREVLHTIPLGYSVDGRPPVDNPVGLHGRELEGRYFLIDADQSYLKDVLTVCNAAGLQVLRFYSEPVASASVTVPDSLKENGIAMADIGGGTTDGIVFRGGRPVGIFTINIAGKLMTNDLSIGLGLPHHEAERIKLSFGILKSSMPPSIEVVNLHDDHRLIGPNEMQGILLPRIHELGLMIAKALLPFRGSLGSGLLLTGGGSEVKGLPEYFKGKMGIPVLKVKPALPCIQGKINETNASTLENAQPPQLATVLGLLNLEIGKLGEQENYRRSTWSSRYLGPILNWLKELA